MMPVSVIPVVTLPEADEHFLGDVGSEISVLQDPDGDAVDVGGVAVICLLEGRLVTVGDPLDEFRIECSRLGEVTDVTIGGVCSCHDVLPLLPRI